MKTGAFFVKSAAKCGWKSLKWKSEKWNTSILDGLSNLNQEFSKFDFHMTTET